MEEKQEESVQKTEEKYKGNKSISAAEAKLTALERRKLVKDIELHILNGLGRAEILKKIVRELNRVDINEGYVENYLSEARRNILKTISTNIDDIKNVHIAHYEKIYNYFNETDYAFGKTKSLQYKERLLGLHREDTFVEINNENNIELEMTDEDIYDTTKLSTDELKRLEFLKYKLEGNFKTEYKEHLRKKQLAVKKEEKQELKRIAEEPARNEILIAKARNAILSEERAEKRREIQREITKEWWRKRQELLDGMDEKGRAKFLAEEEKRRKEKRKLKRKGKKK